MFILLMKYNKRKNKKTKKKYKYKKNNKKKYKYKKKLKYKKLTRLGKKWVKQMEIYMKSIN